MKIQYIQSNTKPLWNGLVSSIAPLKLQGRSISAAAPQLDTEEEPKKVLINPVQLQALLALQYLSMTSSKVITSAVVYTHSAKEALVKNLCLCVSSIIKAVKDLIDSDTKEASKRKGKKYSTSSLELYQMGSVAISKIVTSMAKTFSTSRTKLEQELKDQKRLDELHSEKKAKERRKNFNEYTVQSQRIWNHLLAYIGLKL